MKPPRASARGIFTAAAKPAEAYPPTLTCPPKMLFGRRELLRVPFSHSSPSFWTGHSAKAGKFEVRTPNFGFKMLPHDKKYLEIKFTLNGDDITVKVPPHWTLLRVLRETLGLTGTKEGCGIGECGACTVLMDGKPVNACLILAPKAQGKRVETVEGLGSQDSLHPLQESFILHGAVQCGFCTPGILMSAKALLDETPHPSKEEVKEAISGHLCRCTGYQQMIEAIKAAGEK